MKSFTPHSMHYYVPCKTRCADGYPDTIEEFWEPLESLGSRSRLSQGRKAGDCKLRGAGIAAVDDKAALAAAQPEFSSGGQV